MDDYCANLEDANKVYNWYSNDQEDYFDKNIKIFPEFFKKHGYTKESIKYRFNNYGFRSDTFNNNSRSVMFLGCSHTFGVGLDYKNTFSKIVSNELKLDCFNLGSPGGSNDTCFRFGYYWIPKLLPKIVVYVVPQLHRLELKINNTFVNFLPNGDSTTYKIKTSEAYKQWVSEEMNVILQAERNLNAIKYICKQNNVILRITDSGFPNQDYGRGFARDMNHFGAEAHKAKAQQILNIIEKENHFNLDVMLS